MSPKITKSPVSTSATVAKVATATIAGGGKAALRGAAGSLVKEVVTRTAGPEVAKQVLKAGGRAAVRVAPVLAVMEFGLEQAAAKAAYERGELTAAEYQEETAGNLGNAAGGLGGAMGGAALGTLICPGVGTLIGGFLGGIFGGKAGRATGKAVGSL